MPMPCVLFAVVWIILLAVLGALVREATFDDAGVVVVGLLRRAVPGASVSVRVPVVLVADLVVVTATGWIGGGWQGGKVGLAAPWRVSLGGLVGGCWLWFQLAGCIELRFGVGACGEIGVSEK